jgi:hypothetical protein
VNSTDREFQVRATSVEVTEFSLCVALEDGRVISVPIWWYPRLHEATEAQRQNWQLLPGHYGIHWPEVDEDIGV